MDKKFKFLNYILIVLLFCNSLLSFSISDEDEKWLSNYGDYSKIYKPYLANTLTIYIDENVIAKSYFEENNNEGQEKAIKELFEKMKPSNFVSGHDIVINTEKKSFSTPQEAKQFLSKIENAVYICLYTDVGLTPNIKLCKCKKTIKMEVE